MTTMYLKFSILVIQPTTCSLHKKQGLFLNFFWKKRFNQSLKFCYIFLWSSLFLKKSNVLRQSFEKPILDFYLFLSPIKLSSYFLAFPTDLLVIPPSSVSAKCTVRSHEQLKRKYYKKLLNPSSRNISMKIKDLPEQNRPRERFLKHGPDALSDSELFAIILRTGSPSENVIDMSNRLIKEYGLNNLFDCSLNELQKIKGIGPSKAMQLLAMAELGKRYSQSKNPIKKISRSKDVFDLFHERLKTKTQEEFYVLMLNNKNNVIKEHLIYKGTLDAAIIEPREVFKEALKNSAAKIILIHNHPSGDPKPSDEDVEVTRKINSLGKELNINLLDHIIIGNGNYFSLKERLPEFH